MAQSNASHRTLNPARPPRREATTAWWYRTALVAAAATALVSPVAAQVKSTGEFGITFAPGRQVAPAASGNGADGFTIVWTSGDYASTSQDGSGPGIIAQPFDEGRRIGGELQANTYTTEGQRSPAVAIDPSGAFVVVWTSASDQYPDDTQDGDGAGVFAQRFDAAGTRLGGELQVNQTTQGNQDAAAVARDAAGNFVVVWTSDDLGAPGPNGKTSGVFARRYDADGVPLGDEFLVNAYTTGSQGSPAVAAGADGRFVVVWSSVDDGTGDARDHFGIFGRRFDASATPLADEFQVNESGDVGETQPSVAHGPEGSFVVVWTGTCEPPACPERSDDVLARRFDGAGAALGPAFAVNEYTTGVQSYPAVAADGIGAFMVAWTSDRDAADGPDGSEAGVFGRLFDTAGAPSSGEIQLNEYTTGDQAFPTVAVTGRNQFVVAWVRYPSSQYGTGSDLYARRFQIDCVGPSECDDGNACTVDACTVGDCSHNPEAGCQACTSAGQCTSGCLVVPDQCSEGRCVIDDACPRVSVPDDSPVGAGRRAEVTIVLPATAAGTLKAKVTGTIITALPEGRGCREGRKVTKNAGAKLRGGGTTVVPVGLSKLGRKCLAAGGSLPVRLTITIRAKKTPVSELSVARSWTQ